MKRCMKWLSGMAVAMVMLTNVTMAEKKFVPIIMDDMISMATYRTTTNNLKIPLASDENGYKDLVVQCEDDITYFIMSHHVYLSGIISASSGNIAIEEEGVSQEDTAYVKGYIEGNETVSLTSRFYYGEDLFGEVTKTCNRSHLTSTNNLKVPTFSGNSQGKLVIQCEKDAVYYIMAYDCLRSDTNPWVTTDNGTPITEEKKHVGEVFYVKGYVERKNSDPVTITGHVYSGGQELYIWPDWKQTCQ